MNLKAAGLDLVYPSAHGEMKLSFQPGVVQRTPDAVKQSGIIISGNHQENISGERDRLPATLEALSRFRENLQRFGELANTLVGLEG